MPRLDPSVTIYEVDVAEAHVFKTARLEGVPPPTCRRVAISADLRDPEWPATLLAHGFDPLLRSFFLVEGLLMYLPPEAPARLLKTCASLMAPGSAIAGDTLAAPKIVAAQITAIRRLGSKFTFSCSSKAGAVAMLEAAGFSEAVVMSINAFKSSAATEINDAFVMLKAAGVRLDLTLFYAWPPLARAQAAAIVVSPTASPPAEDADVVQVIRSLIDSEDDHHGLRDATPELKARVVAATIEDGYASKVRVIVDTVRSANTGAEHEGDDDGPCSLAYAVFYAVKRSLDATEATQPQ